MAHLIFTLLFIAAAVFYFYSAIRLHRRGDGLKWLRLTTGIGFALMAIGFLATGPGGHGLVSLGAIMVFVSAIATAILTIRRGRSQELR